MKKVVLALLAASAAFMACAERAPESVRIFYQGKTGDTVRLKTAAIVIYPERSCNLENVPKGKFIVAAVQSGSVPLCAYAVGDDIYLENPLIQYFHVMRFMDFPLARVNPDGLTATITQPNFDWSHDNTQAAMKQLDDIRRAQTAPLPPRN